ncbi:hypothetical protein JW890_05745, partial [candidate division WOR-3 bacterium]|nr:hypothetical protein [candidate division WOR-3 bacterium]
SEGKAFEEEEAGVGAARKTGFDEALRFLRDDDILISLDADVVLSKNFFQKVISRYIEKPKLSGLTVDTFHFMPDDDRHLSALISYEIYLRYYYHGLLMTKNPYVFWSVGSSMSFRKKAYIAVGGFNKRKAGEDFYFLRKLSFHGKIEHVKDAFVTASPRMKSKTPYGTAASVRDLYEGKRELSLMPSPQIFKDVSSHYDEIKKWRTTKTAGNFLCDSEKMKIFLDGYNHRNVLETALSNSSNPRNFMKMYYKWFDALRIRQYVNSDKRKIPLSEAIYEMFGIDAGSKKIILEELRSRF